MPGPAPYLRRGRRGGRNPQGWGSLRPGSPAQRRCCRGSPRGVDHRDSYLSLSTAPGGSAPVVGRLLPDRFLVGFQRLVDDHGQLNAAAEVAGQQALDVCAETILQLVAGEGVRHGDHQHVVVERHRLTGRKPAPQARRGGGVEMVPGQTCRFGGALRRFAHSTPLLFVHPVQIQTRCLHRDTASVPGVQPVSLPHRYPQSVHKSTYDRSRLPRSPGIEVNERTLPAAVAA